jgi:hypothetical protein
MAKYVFAFRNDPNQAASAAEVEAWNAWFGELGGTVIDFGNRVSRTSMVGGGTEPDALSGYVVVRCGSVGASLQEPRCFDRILDRACVAIGEVRDNHHVLLIAGRDAERSGQLPQYRVAIIEIGTDHQLRAVKLAGDQPAVIPPLGPPAWRTAAHSRQGLRHAAYFVDIHETRSTVILDPRASSATS